jgi:hypothetical protein
MRRSQTRLHRVLQQWGAAVCALALVQDVQRERGIIHSLGTSRAMSRVSTVMVVSFRMGIELSPS